MTRETKITIILGRRRCGKTTLLRSILESSNQKAMVLTPHAVEWCDYPDNFLDKPEDYKFAGINRQIYNESSIDKLMRFTRGIIVFDDCRLFFEANEKTNKQLRRFYIASAQNMTDLFIVAHGYGDVLPIFFRFATDFIIFTVNDNIGIRKDAIGSNFGKLKDLQETVNKKAQKDIHYFKHFKN